MNRGGPEKPGPRSRWLYIAMTAGFGVVAVGAAVSGAAAVAALAAVAFVVTGLLLLFSKQLTRWMNPDQED